MRLPLLTVIILALLNTATDLYIYKVLRSRCRNPIWSRIQAVSAVVLLLVLLGIALSPYRTGSDSWLLATMWLLFSYISVYLAKYIFVVFDLIASLPRLWHGKRINLLNWTGIGLGAICFVLMWWGALVNRFQLQVTEREVFIPDLPEAFDGYRIIQFSDLHTGTFGNDTTFTAKLTDRINSLDGDLIVFTGDIVNRRSEELVPHMSTLSRLHAPDGVLSILGNHDYGDYYSAWESDAAKANDVMQLKAMEHDMGWTMLNDSSVTVHHNGDSIVVLGVENIGDPPFRIYGSMERAWRTAPKADTYILLTHNPAHWDGDISVNPAYPIDLTLSGHTHAMQMEAFGLSPASSVYPHWGGLYRVANGRQLNVNIGSGTVGMPMRVGATPEITVLILRRKGL